MFYRNAAQSQGKIVSILSILSLVLAACQQVVHPPTLVLSPTAALIPSATAISVTSHPATPISTQVAVTQKPAESCPPADATWRQMNSLVYYDIHDGLAGDAGCSLWLVGERVNPSVVGVLLRSDDAGKTIRTVAAFPKAHVLRRIGYDSQAAGWIVGDTKDGSGLLLKSTDAGQTWTEVALPLRSTWLNALAFSNGKVWVGGVLDHQVLLLSSADNGMTWVAAPLHASPPMVQIRMVSARNETIMVVGADASRGVIAISRDNGANFQTVASPVNMTVATIVVMTDSQHAYVGGYFTANGRVENGTAILLQTNDAGSTWISVSVPDKAVLIGDLLFLSAESGYGLIYGIQRVQVRGDGTLVWGDPEPLVPKPDFGVSRLFAASNGTIYAVGVGGAGLFRSRP